MDLVQPMPYTTFQAIVDAFNQKGGRNYHRGLHLTGFSDEVMGPYLAAGRDIHSPLTQGLVFQNGGAISRVAEDDTAAGNRAAPFMAHPIACWLTTAEDAYELDWVAKFSAAFAPATTGGTYLNFEPGTSHHDLLAGFGQDKYSRLVELKGRWDPTNLFRSNHNINPELAPAV
ncbi:BBE domain-containing protein [Raineyella fluvialis]